MFYKKTYSKTLIIFFILLSIFINNPAISQIQSSQNILELNGLIVKFEKGFLKFAEDIGKILIKYKDRINPKTAEAIKAPLRLFIENIQKNTNRNYRQYALLQVSKGKTPPFHRFEDNSFFYYEVLPQKYLKFGPSSFSMHTRIMYINPYYDPNSFFDNLIAFHEMVHAYQDTIFRNLLKTQGEQGEAVLTKYLSLLPQGIKDPDLEPVAYAIELELLNIMLQGGLRKIIKTQNEIPINEIAKILQANTPYKIEVLRNLLNYAIYYFGHDCWIYSYTEIYRTIILKDHIKLGARFYESENRFIKPIPASQENRNSVPQTPTPQQGRRTDANQAPGQNRTPQNSNNNNETIIQIN